MKQLKNYTEMVIRYIDHDLEPNEAAWVEKLIESDPEAKEEYLIQLDIKKVFSDSSVIDFREKISAVIEEEEKQSGIYQFLSGNRKVASLLAAASVVLVAGMVWFLAFRKPNPETLFEQNYSPYEINYVARSDENPDLSQTLMNAFEKFNNKDFENATLLFDQVLRTDPDNIPANLYSGISNIEIEQYLKATEKFRVVLKHEDNFFIDQAEWYMGLCYLKLHDLKKAKEIFKHIASTDSYYNKNAAHLAKHIK